MRERQVQEMRRKDSAALGAALIALPAACALLGQTVYASEEPIVLRVCNWEEYIDLGEWDEDEAIELDNGTTILGERIH